MGEPHSLFRIRPNPDWDTDAEKLVRPGETAEHLDGRTACRYGIREAGTVLTKYRRYSGQV